jgi:hypothetical protein
VDNDLELEDLMFEEEKLDEYFNPEARENEVNLTERWASWVSEIDR